MSATTTSRPRPRPLDLPLARAIVGATLLGLGYYGLARIGYLVQYTGGVQAIWMPVGLAAATAYRGDMRWVAGAAVADLVLGLPVHTAGELAVGVAQTIGNMLEVLAIALILRALIGRRRAFDRPEDILRLILAVAVGTSTSTTIGTLSLYVHGDIGRTDIAEVWRTWFIGDSTGALLVLSLLLAWVPPPRISTWSTSRRVEAICTLLVVVALSVVVATDEHPLTYVVFPALILATVRFGQLGGTLAMAIAAAATLIATAHEIGPFVQASIDDEALSTQLYFIVGTLTVLIVGALVDERQRNAVEVADLHRRELERTTEERQRIARDLHDSVSQSLFSLGLQAGIARHELERSGLPPAGPLGAALEEVSALAGAALAEMRGLIFELRPDALAEEGLVGALRRHAAAVSAGHGVPIAVEGPGEPLRLPLDTEEHLYRLAQEALGNAARHAGASMIRVVVRVAAGVITLAVSDDGRGFDPDASYPGHLGLASLRGRAADIGGQLALRSAPGAGTTVEVRIAEASA